MIVVVVVGVGLYFEMAGMMKDLPASHLLQTGLYVPVDVKIVQSHNHILQTQGRTQDSKVS